MKGTKYSEVLRPMWEIEQNAIEAHASTNHFYDKYLPYEYHLRMVVGVMKRHQSVIDAIVSFYGEVTYGHLFPQLAHLNPVKLIKEHFLGGGWYHDGYEDARLTFNDVVKLTNQPIVTNNLKHGYGKFVRERSIADKDCDVVIAMVARAVTSDPTGIDRETRMHDGVYQRIVETPIATFAKEADRIANVQYGIMNGEAMSMPKKYAKENDKFQARLSKSPEYEFCAPMVKELDELFKQVQ